MAQRADEVQPPPASESSIIMERIRLFSDAVFAIAITLLSLDLMLPSGTTTSDLAHNLNSIWPKYLAFFFTFFLIGLRWMTHLLQFRYIRNYDYMLLGLNLLLLCSVAFLPFTSRVLANYPNSQTASILYLASMAAAGLISTALWAHACWNGHLIDGNEIDARTQRNLFWRWAVLPIFFGVAIILVLVAPNLWFARVVAFATPIAQIVLAVRARRAGQHA